MARPADPHGAEDILRIVGQQPDGATIEQIAQLVNVPRRTLQRRLAELVTSGRARAIGRGKQRRYQLGTEEGARPDELRVSRSGQQVRSLVRRPLIQRSPVGYVASFLDGSRPNHDFYLDPLRLRNRDQLTEVVNAIVRDDAPIDDTPIRALAAPLVAPDDLDDFIAMAISELSGLHEGNLARYRLRPSEFRRWRGRRREPPSS